VRRLVIILLVGALAVIAALWAGRGFLAEQLRRRAERALADAAGSPSRIGRLEFSLIPLRLGAADVSVGTAPAIATLGAVDVELHFLESIAQGRPVLSLALKAPSIDLNKLPPSTTGGAPRVPPLALRDFRVTGVKVRFTLGKDPATLTIGELAGRLSSAVIGRRVEVTLAATDAELQRKGFSLRLAAVEGDGGIDTGGVYLQSAALRGERVRLEAHALPAARRYEVTGAFDPAVLGVLVDELGALAGRGEVAGTVSGDLVDPVSDLQVTIADGAIAGHVLGDLRMQLRHSGATLRFDDIELTRRRVTVSGTVELILHNEVPIHGRLRWEPADVEELLSVMGPHLAFADRLRATTDVHGSLDPLDLMVTGVGAVETPDSARPLGEFDLAGRVKPRWVDASVRLRQPQGNAATARVTVDGTGLRGQFEVQAADLAALVPLLPLRGVALAVAGRGHLEGMLAGTTQAPALTATFALDRASLGGIAVPALRGEMGLADRVLTVRSVRMTTARGRADFSGQVALDRDVPNDWRLSVAGVEADLLLDSARALSAVRLPIRGGTLDAEVTGRGPWTHLALSGTATADGLTVAGEVLSRIELSGKAALPQWSGQARVVLSPGQVLTADATGVGVSRLQVTAAAEGLELSRLRSAAARQVGGTVDVRVQLGGSAAQPVGSATIDGRDVRWGDARLGEVILQATGESDVWHLAGTLLSGAVQIDAAARTRPGVPFDSTVRWADADLTPLLGRGDEAQVVSSGEVRVRGRLEDPLAASGSVDVTRLSIRRPPAEIELAEPLRAELTQGRLRLRSFVLSGLGSRLSVTGDVRADRTVDLRIEGGGDLAWLQVVGRPLEAANGQFSLEADVSYRAAAGWALHGRANVNDAQLDFGPALVLSDVSGALGLVGRAVTVEQLTGRLGGGDFAVGGTVDLQHGPDLSWKLREVSLAVPEWLEERISGNGRVYGTWEAITIGGDVDVLYALYDQQIEVVDLLPWFRKRTTPVSRAGALPVAITLDLRIHASDSLFIDNNFARVELRGDLRVEGSATAPVLKGSVEVVDGEVFFRDRRFTLTSGSLVFQDPHRINPILSFNAETRVRTTDADYGIYVVVTGTANDPRVQLSADDPTLSQNDIFSLLTIGRTVAQARREGGGVSTGDVLALMPGGYSRQIQHTLGLDRMQVEAAYASDTRSIEPRVTIGKEITERLSVQASTRFGVEQRNTIGAEYRLTRRISLLADWENATKSEAGAFGAGITFRYEFRRLPYSLRTESEGATQGNGR
jgi:hypothetical protein